eukprot:COSAG04_NODE_8408_length_980_cov_1.875142_1_plen_237_part_00
MHHSGFWRAADSDFYRFAPPPAPPPCAPELSVTRAVCLAAYSATSSDEAVCGDSCMANEESEIRGCGSVAAINLFVLGDDTKQRDLDLNRFTRVGQPIHLPLDHTVNNGEVRAHSGLVAQLLGKACLTRLRRCAAARALAHAHAAARPAAAGALPGRVQDGGGRRARQRARGLPGAGAGGRAVLPAVATVTAATPAQRKVPQWHSVYPQPALLPSFIRIVPSAIGTCSESQVPCSS